MNHTNEPDFNEPAEENSASTVGASEGNDPQDYCDECNDNIATKLWHDTPVCDDCYTKLDNYDGPADSEGEPPPTLDELHQRAFRQKYYGEGL